MKGGVGKTTLAFNLAWYAAWQEGLRVLAVDLDPQSNLSQYFMGAEEYKEYLEDNDPNKRNPSVKLANLQKNIKGQFLTRQHITQIHIPPGHTWANPFSTQTMLGTMSSKNSAKLQKSF